MLQNVKFIKHNVCIIKQKYAIKTFLDPESNI